MPTVVQLFLKRFLAPLARVALLTMLVQPGVIMSPILGQAQSGGYSIRSSTELSGGRTSRPGREVQCSCVTGNDKITVYRVDGDTPISKDLDQPADFDGTLWLFDSGDTGNTQIAVLFHQVEGKLTADVYQDQDGDGKVEVSVRRSGVSVREPGFWSIRVVALDGYWQRDGRIAPNFDLTVDDKFIAAFGGENYQDQMANDGAADLVIRVRGPSAGDPRSYDWRNVYSPVPQSSAIFRSVLMVREEGLEPAFAPSYPWYLIGDVTGLIKDYGKSTAPIQIDWKTGKIAQLGEFVASRGSDVNWFTYSIVRVEPSELADPNFESPFAFYDLADDGDSVPELQVRVVRANKDDPYIDSPIAWRGRPYQQIRYSWDQANTQNWTFKVALLGQYSIDTEVAFPDFSLITIPYEDVPQWVVERKWDIASFVAAESPLWTTEGIYHLDPSLTLRDSYYAGVGESTGGFGSSIEAGRRGEYALHLADQPWLYFSPIDGRLHLESADSGIWNVDDERELRYLNSSGGATFDGWQLWDNGQLAQQLYRMPNGLLYSDDRGTYYLAADISDSLFRTLPPTNNQEWETLGQQLEENRRNLTDADLRAMFDQFGDDPVLIASGPMTAFARTGTGASFLVRANDSISRDALASLTGSDIVGGMQTVSLSGNDWTATAAQFIPPQMTISVTPQGNLTTVPVEVTISNPGSLALNNAVVTVRANIRGTEIGVPLGSKVVALNAGETTVLSFPWAPGRADTWTIQATIERSILDARGSGQPILLEAEASVPVADSELSPKDASELGWNSSLMKRAAALIGLIGLAGIMATVALRKRLVQ